MRRVIQYFRRHYRLIVWCNLIGYIIIIYYVTLFSRVSKDVIRYDFHIFWSYKAIFDGREDLILEHILNVLLFIPLGSLLWCLLKRKRWWKALEVGCLLSLSIEFTQLVLKRGLSELDDVFHNSLGAIIGFWIAAGVVALAKKLNCRPDLRTT